ncbi:MAG: PilT/PilU family type 4a pilus ATPase [Mariprofundales bacterium]|nr:PilT/PilU family type 4a pilus ATPase [Mariprofundales bacterium]
MQEPKKLGIRKLLKIMSDQDASDLYITAGMPPGYRIKGAVTRVGSDDLSSVDTEQLANSVMSGKQKARFSTEMEMNLSLSYPGIGRFRVNIFRQMGAIGLVIRKIETTIMGIDDLKLPEIFKEIAMTTRGLVIMVGGTGSGKSTSLAAMVDWRNSNQAGHIITIEDPVEYVHQHKKCVITQREVGTDTLSFQAALKNTLRQAPDVILLGEIREEETMEQAIEFAETGHLAMATLHANNANQAIDRILNFFPEEKHPQVYMNLSMNLRAILSQRLVKTVDGKRAAAIEILVNTPRISDLILKGEVGEIKDAMVAGGEQYGMVTFDQALLKLWREGKITEVEALRNSDSPNDLRLKMKMAKLESSDDDDGASATDKLLNNNSDGDGTALSI